MIIKLKKIIQCDNTFYFQSMWSDNKNSDPETITRSPLWPPARFTSGRTPHRDTTQGEAVAGFT